MKVSPYTNCTSYFDVFTGSGSIQGLYDFGSGVNNIIYNLIYPTGKHYSGGNIYSPVKPLVSLGRSNVSNYTFSGINCYSVGYENSGDFGLIIDMEYSGGCSKTTTGVGHVILSTSSNATGTDNTFFIGINDANRLFWGTSGRFDQLNYELKTRNLLYVAYSESKYVNYGVFDYLNQSYNGRSITLENDQQLVNKIYLGGFLNNTNVDYTGFFGRINDVVFFNSDIQVNDLSECSNCLFATGQTGSPNVKTYAVPAITGYVLSGVSGLSQTGSILVTGQLTNYSGGIVNVVFDSGLWANIQTGLITLLLTGTSIVTVTGRDTVNFHNDTSRQNYFNVFDIGFSCPLASGDILEIYAHRAHSPYVNYNIENLVYPTSDNFVQLVGNGLVETLGIDYSVERGLISGFYDDDVLGYDIYSGSSAVMAYSGFWPRSRILMSGGSYFPPTGQFGERSGTMVTGFISGQPVTTRSNFFLNGQKLISGIHYNIWNDLTFNYFGLTGYVVELYPSGSGIFADFIADVLRAPNGSGTGIGEVQDSELTMLDTWDTNYNRYLYEATGDKSVYQNVTGFSEQVWVNGVRLLNGRDYRRNFRCTLNSGFLDDLDTNLVVINNDSGYFNIG